MAARFSRDLDFDLQRITTLIEHARQLAVGLLVLPDAALGDYLDDLRSPNPDTLPPALALDDPHVRKVAALAAEMVVCFGFCEAQGIGASTPRCVYMVTGSWAVTARCTSRPASQSRTRQASVSPPSTPLQAGSAC
ncbi:MAG TPA: hypothetical protein VHH52_06665 [Pseudonocardiaceae bacterium]|nr:hypothetical protein [Pseudonocardiaceae bacterium]